MRPLERGTTDRGFRQQLLERLKNQARRQGTDPRRLQQRVAFERLLARLEASGEWLLKGGFAHELRYGWHNHPTKDIGPRTMQEPMEAIAGSPNADRLRSVPHHQGRVR